MVRAALESRRRIGRGPIRFAIYLPAATVVAGSLMAALPFVSSNGWFPDMGYLVLIGWRLLRSDPWPAWWAAPLGLVNDMFTGEPIGFSIALWSATMLALDMVDRRTMWRDYWIEWVFAAVLIAINEWLEWWIAGLMGARVPFGLVAAPMIIAIFTFPITAWFVARLDHWRLGR